MADERIVRSVRELRIFQRRSKEAGQRNKQKRCACQVGSPSHLVHIGGKKRSRGEKAIILSRHGALHGVFGARGCPHSTLASTTKPKTEGRSKVLVIPRSIPVLVIR